MSSQEHFGPEDVVVGCDSYPVRFVILAIIRDTQQTHPKIKSPSSLAIRAARVGGIYPNAWKLIRLSGSHSDLLVAVRRAVDTMRDRISLIHPSSVPVAFDVDMEMSGPATVPDGPNVKRS